MKGIAGVALLLLPLIVLAAKPTSADNRYRPLTETQFKAFDDEYWKLSECQNKYLQGHTTPDELAARLIELGRAEELIDVASGLLAGEEPFVSIMKKPDVPVAMKVKASMAGLAMYGAREGVLPSQNMRAFGVVRKYTAVAIAPACQPSPQFLASLKVMLDEHF
jgi:hypothetical protein